MGAFTNFYLLLDTDSFDLIDDINFLKFLYPLLKTVQIQISWLLMEPADQDLHCLSITMNPYF